MRAKDGGNGNISNDDCTGDDPGEIAGGGVASRLREGIIVNVIAEIRSYKNSCRVVRNLYI